MLIRTMMGHSDCVDSCPHDPGKSGIREPAAVVSLRLTLMVTAPLIAQIPMVITTVLRI